jgi:hypothetical protein
MKQLISLMLLLAAGGASAQKKVQELQPVRLSVFKNGTCFVKREGPVTVSGQTFYIQAPQNVLLGTYWLGVGKEASVHSIVVKSDTFRIQHPATSLGDYLRANIGKEVVLYRHTESGNTAKIAGKVISYDADKEWLKLRTEDKKLLVVASGDYDELAMDENTESKYWCDSITPTAKVNLNKAVDNTMATTLSLEKGILWYPSYLLRIVNDKEAKLEMKATIFNTGTSFKNTLVDIVIGNPEMFYGKDLDPVCADYLSGVLLSSARYDNSRLSNSVNGNYSGLFSQSRGDAGGGDADDEGDLPDAKDGEKLEDLYYYQLGMLSLEQDARVIVPVLSATVNYQDIYTADLDSKSGDFDENKILDVFHGYRIGNNTTAPFTTGSVLVVNQKELPMAQAQLKYTSVKGNAEIRLSKALDVQLKNDELETKRDANAKSFGYNSFYDKVTYTGKIGIVNMQNKKITIRVKKTLTGIVLKMDNNGTGKKIKDDGGARPTTLITWEVTLEPGAKKELAYDYYTYKNER